LEVTERIREPDGGRLHKIAAARDGSVLATPPPAFAPPRAGPSR
jgi:hypothetical protein